jgi:hypothetical protein
MILTNLPDCIGIVIDTVTDWLDDRKLAALDTAGRRVDSTGQTKEGIR